MSWLLVASSTTLSILGSGKSSFGQALFRSVKSIHIYHFPFFFFTGTVLASHVGYLTSLMTLASNNLWTSALTAATLSSDILQGFCFLGLMDGSMSSRCSMISLLTPRRSLVDQAKQTHLYSCSESQVILVLLLARGLH